MSDTEAGCFSTGACLFFIISFGPFRFKHEMTYSFRLQWVGYYISHWKE